MNLLVVLPMMAVGGWLVGRSMNPEYSAIEAAARAITVMVLFYMAGFLSMAL